MMDQNKQEENFRYSLPSSISKELFYIKNNLSHSFKLEKICHVSFLFFFFWRKIKISHRKKKLKIICLIIRDKFIYDINTVHRWIEFFLMPITKIVSIWTTPFVILCLLSSELLVVKILTFLAHKDINQAERKFSAAKQRNELNLYLHISEMLSFVSLCVPMSRPSPSLWYKFYQC
jgi:hypothetical protein